MSAPKHTPGPWLSHRANDDEVIDIYTVEHNEPTTPSPVARTYTQANARLIAAAPDLLAALKATVPVLEAMQRMVVSSGLAAGHKPGGPLNDQIAAALSKAEPTP